MMNTEMMWQSTACGGGKGKKRELQIDGNDARKW
jgi:hypothetical protein